FLSTATIHTYTLSLHDALPISAAQWLETASEDMLFRAVRDYGEETHWRRVVRALIAARGTGALARTASLAETIAAAIPPKDRFGDRKSTRLNSSHVKISYAVFC